MKKLSKQFSDFVSLLKSCKRYNLEARLDSLHGAVGLCTEASEILDIYKKGIFYGRPIKQADILEELGDAIHYIQMICNENGFTIEDLIKTNMMKLYLRYPDGYSDDNALNRDKLSERKVFSDFIKGI